MEILSALNSLPPILLFSIFFYLGACLGSWLSAASYRIPRGIDVVNARSFCPHCKKQLQNRDNVPIFAYLALRGRSRCCHQPYGARYFLLEATSGAILGLLALLNIAATLILALLVIVIPTVVGIISHHSAKRRSLGS